MSKKMNRFEWAKYEIGRIVREHNTIVSSNEVYMLIRVESSWRHDTVSSKGARGLGQLMPRTAAKFKLDPKNITNNIYMTIMHFETCVKFYNGNRAVAIAAYNYGIPRMNKWLKYKRSLPKETTGHVGKWMLEMSLEERSPSELAYLNP